MKSEAYPPLLHYFYTRIEIEDENKKSKGEGIHFILGLCDCDKFGQS